MPSLRSLNRGGTPRAARRLPFGLPLAAPQPPSGVSCLVRRIIIRRTKRASAEEGTGKRRPQRSPAQRKERASAEEGTGKRRGRERAGAEERTGKRRGRNGQAQAAAEPSAETKKQGAEPRLRPSPLLRSAPPRAAFCPPWAVFCPHDTSVHAVLIVVVGETAENLELTVAVQEGDGGMVDTVEHRRLDGCIVQHVLKDDVLAHRQLMVESP